MKNTLIYLHGFNSASVDGKGALLPDKQKLHLLNEVCQQNQVQFQAPNLDYTNPAVAAASLVEVAEDLALHNPSGDITFIGTSLGGFMAAYMGMRTNTAAIMINPAINPSLSLRGYIGPCQNYATGERYLWTRENCKLFIPLKQALNQASGLPRTLLIDMGDEVLDSNETLMKYRGIADVHKFPGGSHRFEHIHEALPIIKNVILSTNNC
ncbi:MAG: hypothetical protein IMF09_08570 [Proteobacteria bacterium]|nr:hypothetical protein [Pseudomonadota bacterium]